MRHLQTHPTPQPDCFGCKLQSLNWGIVPGGFKDTNSTTMFDRDQLLQQFGDKDGNSVFDKERVEDMRSDFNHAKDDFLSYD